MAITTVTCATEKCCEPIYMPEEKLTQYRATHATFYCQKGHANFFPKGPSAVDKLREEVAMLKRSLEQRGRTIENTRDKLVHTRWLLIEALHEPGIHYLGDYHFVWICTCLRKGKGTCGEENTRRLLKAHAARMHCNPLTNIEVTA